MTTRTIAVLTATRAEYGPLRCLMLDIRADERMTLRTIVTGTHLSPSHGMTYKEIEKDGLEIDASVDMGVVKDTPGAIAEAIGRCSAGVGQALADLTPDILVLLGDRYELLAAAAAATVAGIPIAHISGGDVTVGSMDNQFRHALTKLSHLHFPSTEESAARIVQMGEEPSTVHVVGEPGLENLRRLPRIPRGELADMYDLDPERSWAIFAYHPETAVSSDANEERAESALQVLAETDSLQTVLTFPNSDPGWSGIVRILQEHVGRNRVRFRLVQNLGQQAFLSLMRESKCIVGNSSAAIMEAPSVELPAVNIGQRQVGRIMAANVIASDGLLGSLRTAITRAVDPQFRRSISGLENPYGDGFTSERIRSVLATVELDGLVRKGFRVLGRSDARPFDL